MHRLPVAPRHAGLALLILGVGPALVAVGQTSAPPRLSPTSRLSAADLELLRSTVGLMRAILIGLIVVAIPVGFLLVATGLTRGKNAAHTAGQVLLTFALSVIGFWACGFALMFGGAGAIGGLGEGLALDRMVSIPVGGVRVDVAGMRGFFLKIDSGSSSLAWLFLVQLGFVATATLIPIGALAERWRLGASCLFALAMATTIYPIVGCWAWGGGWLAGMGRTLGLGNGFVDLAGSGVVHLSGGVAALVGALRVGPRIGKFRKDGLPNPIPGHNIVMVVVGSLFMAASWVALGAGGGLLTLDLGVGPMAVRGLLAASAGCLGACLYAWLFFGKPDPTLCCNGLLAGAVAIAAPCAFVSPMGAVVIGGLAGLLAIGGILAIERVLKVDDPIGVVAVHGLCGAFGCLCVGLFSTGDYGKGWNGVADATPLGVLYGGGLGQLAAQMIGVATVIAWVAPPSVVAFWVIDKLVGNRVLARAEVEGLDIPETGVLGYVAEETHVVATAGQIYLASHGPGVPMRSSFVPPRPPSKSH